mmetsp:Transcript_13743/g.47929  ORF Transcript_13743/g.47929 Transcript_13743/m.47929 type:complete len:272 (+) Transcript_13743:61-876(+)
MNVFGCARLAAPPAAAGSDAGATASWPRPSRRRSLLRRSSMASNARSRRSTAGMISACPECPLAEPVSRSSFSTTSCLECAPDSCVARTAPAASSRPSICSGSSPAGIGALDGAGRSCTGDRVPRRRPGDTSRACVDATPAGVGSAAAIASWCARISSTLARRRWLHPAGGPVGDRPAGTSRPYSPRAPARARCRGLALSSGGSGAPHGAAAASCCTAYRRAAPGSASAATSYRHRSSEPLRSRPRPRASWRSRGDSAPHSGWKLSRGRPA